MKRTFVRLAAVFLILTTLCAVLPAGAMAAATISPVVTSYEVHNRTNPSQKNLTMGNAADITFHFKDMSTTTDVASSIDVTKLVDSFSTATATATITSTGTNPLEFDVKVENVTYSGTGKGMTLMIAYAGTYTTITQNISEATEYVAPTPDPEPDYTPDTAPAPMLIISRGDIKEPIRAGQEMEVTISIQNLSNLTLRTPLIKYTPSDSLMLTGGSSTFVLADIGAKKTVTTTVKIRALETISSSQQSLGVSLTYDYFNNVSTVQGNSSETVTIPAKATTGGGTTPEPPVIVTRSAVSAISANQVFELTLTFKNAGTTKLVSPVATISTSEALVLQNDTSTFVLPDIEAGKSQSVTLKLKAASEISSTPNAPPA